MPLTCLSPVSELPTLDASLFLLYLLAPLLRKYLLNFANLEICPFFLMSQQATASTLCNHVPGANKLLSGLCAA